MQLFRLPPALAVLALSSLVAANPAGPVRPPPHESEPEYPTEPNTNHNTGSDDDPINNPAVAEAWAQTPPQAEQIQYEPAPEANTCFGKESCDEILDVAKDVLEKLEDLANDIADAVATTTTTSVPPYPTFTGAAGNFSTPVSALYPNLNQANLYANQDVSEPYIGLFSSDEQQLLAEQPVCFFANAQRIYSSAAAMQTTQPSRRQISQIEACEQDPEPVTCTQISTMTIDSHETAGISMSYFATYLPGQILSVYAPATVTQSGDVLATSATSCTGFDGNVYTTSYIKEQVGTGSPTTAMSGTGTGSTPAATSTQGGGAGRGLQIGVSGIGWDTVAMLSCAWLAGVAVIAV